jgi:hypothetical protein
MIIYYQQNSLRALGKVKELPLFFSDLPLNITLKEYLLMHFH